MHHRAALLSQAALQHYKEQTPVRWMVCAQRPSFYPQAQQWQHCSADCCGGNISGIAQSYALACGDFHLPAGRSQRQPAALCSHMQSHHVPIRSQHPGQRACSDEPSSSAGSMLCWSQPFQTQNQRQKASQALQPALQSHRRCTQQVRSIQTAHLVLRAAPRHTQSVTLLSLSFSQFIYKFLGKMFKSWKKSHSCSFKYFFCYTLPSQTNSDTSLEKAPGASPIFLNACREEACNCMLQSY